MSTVRLCKDCRSAALEEQESGNGVALHPFALKVRAIAGLCHGQTGNPAATQMLRGPILRLRLQVRSTRALLGNAINEDARKMVVVVLPDQFEHLP